MRRRISVATGADVWVEVAGGGPPVVLIHGNMLSAAMWEPQVPALAESFTVIAYDVRGFGRSPYRPGRHSDRADLKALVDELGIERPNLVGLSMGANIALDFALAYPGVAASVVITPGGIPGSPDPAWMEAGWQALESAVNTGDHGAARDVVMSFPPMRSLERNPTARDRVVAMMEHHQWPDWVNKWADYDWLDPPAWGRLEELRLPALVVSGDLDDETFLAEGDAFVRRVPGARKELIEGAGHMVNLEAPDAYTAIVVDHLVTVTERSVARRC